jgi:hypothetical protein
MTVTPVPSANIEPFIVHGTFLYRPDTECWYVGNDSPERPGSSFGKKICSDFIEQI